MNHLSGSIFFCLRFILFGAYLIHGVIAISNNSVVYDETDNWNYSSRIMKGDPRKVYTYDDGPAMPIGVLNTFPRAFQQLMNPGLKKTDGGFSDVMNGRYITLIVCLLIGVFIYYWSKKMFGEKGGLFSLGLFVFCPNLNANAILISYDAYTTLFTLISFYYFWKFVKESGYKNFILFSTGIAIAQISKYSSVHLFIIFGLLSLIVLIKRKSLIIGWKRNLLRLLMLVAIALLVINVAYLFYGSGQQLSVYHFRSSFFQSVQSISGLNRIPMPLPVPYVEGFDITYHMLELGPGNLNAAAKNYLFGEFNTNGLWYYYPAIMLFKTPVSFLIVFVLLLFIYLKKRKFLLISAEFIIGFGLLYFFIVFGFLNNIQNSLRHMLFVYPLLYVLAGRLVWVEWKHQIKKIALAVFILYSLSTYYFYFPNLISYTNELIIDKKNAYKITADCNLDYGQGGYWLKKYLADNSDVKFATPSPQTGKIVIGLNDYVDINGTGEYFWMQQYKPVAHVEHCYLLFDIK